MRADEMDRALVDASPISDAEVAAFDLERAEAELIDGITAPPARAEAADLEARRGRRHLSRGRVAGALVGVAAAVAVTLIGIGSLGEGESPDFAAAAIRVAEANPRLLVTESGWSVTRADEFTTDSGGMTFSNGEHQLEITWYPARLYDRYYDDRTRVDPTPTTLTLLGETARMVQYAPRPDFATMLPPQGETFVEIRGNLGTRERYLEVVRSLQPTDVETWLSAMPASVVQPTDHAAVVDEMLAGLPLPPGLNVDALRADDAVRDRYQLGAQVTGAVACGWLDSWVAATAAGDAAAANVAVEAMSTSRSWPILLEMEDQGGWSQVVWKYARQIENGRLDQGIAGTVTEGDRIYEFGPAYATGLGCDSQFKRLRNPE